MQGYSTPKSYGNNSVTGIAARPSVTASFLNGFAKGLKGGVKEFNNVKISNLKPITNSN